MFLDHITESQEPKNIGDTQTTKDSNLHPKHIIRLYKKKLKNQATKFYKTIKKNRKGKVKPQI